MNIKLKTFCTRNGFKRPEVDETIKRLGIAKFKVGGALHITEADAEVLINELMLPEELVPTLVEGVVLSECRNPMWVMCKFDGIEFKHPCLLPRRFKGKFPKGKRIRAERIEDKNGVTYRHEYFGRLERR